MVQHLTKFAQETRHLNQGVDHHIEMTDITSSVQVITTELLDSPETKRRPFLNIPTGANPIMRGRSSLCGELKKVKPLDDQRHTSKP